MSHGPLVAGTEFLAATWPDGTELWRLPHDHPLVNESWKPEILWYCIARPWVDDGTSTKPWMTVLPWMKDDSGEETRQLDYTYPLFCFELFEPGGGIIELHFEAMSDDTARHLAWFVLETAPELRHTPISVVMDLNLPIVLPEWVQRRFGPGSDFSHHYDRLRQDVPGRHEWNEWDESEEEERKKAMTRSAHAVDSVHVFLEHVASHEEGARQARKNKDWSWPVDLEFALDDREFFLMYGHFDKQIAEHWSWLAHVKKALDEGAVHCWFIVCSDNVVVGSGATAWEAFVDVPFFVLPDLATWRAKWLREGRLPEALDPFRLLGEPLPFWWDDQKFIRWIQDYR